MLPVRHRELRGPFWRTFLDCLVHNPAALKSVIGMMTLYLHLGPFARVVIARIREQIAEIDQGTWKRPPIAPVPVQVPPAPGAVRVR